MSTKIYNAYRVPKTVDILKLLGKIRQLSIEEISENESILKFIHLFAYADAVEVVKTVDKNSPKWNTANYFLKKHKQRKIDVFYIKDFLEKDKRSPTKNIIDVYFDCSVFYDTNYWYIKFFPNIRWMHDVLEKAEQCIHALEDFHYQNQVDIPEDISEQEFEKREEKWDELLDEEGNFRNGFTYTIFDAYEFNKLLTRHYYTREPDLYKHLVYKFDETFKN